MGIFLFFPEQNDILMQIVSIRIKCFLLLFFFFLWKK